MRVYPACMQYYDTAENFQGSNAGLRSPSADNFLTNARSPPSRAAARGRRLSDARIKTVTGEYEPGLDEVLQLRPVTYVYKGNDTPTEDGMSPHWHAAQSGKEFVGFVAQELERIMPGMVSQHAGFIDGEEGDRHQGCRRVEPGVRPGQLRQATQGRDRSD